MPKKTWLRSMLTALVAGAFFLPPGGWTSGGEQPQSLLRVHFETDRATLAPAEQQKIRDRLRHVDLGAQGRIFVLGYTDSTGKQAHNNVLARKRAQAVRRIIIAEPGIDADKVIALGRGAAQPVADNGLAEGRSRNRRAEVHFSQAVGPRAQSRPEPVALSPAVGALLDAADQELRKMKLEASFAKLMAARALGGDRTARWNLLQGIAGFYAGRPPEQIQPYLRNALRLEPAQPEAHEYLGRLEARAKVSGGQVTAAMGRRPEEAIAVGAAGEIYEYLHLFNVRALAQKTLPGRTVSVWECLDPQGRTVCYYFDCRSVHDQAFETQKPARPAPEGLNAAVLSVPAAGSPATSLRPSSIWESELFR